MDIAEAYPILENSNACLQISTGNISVAWLGPPSVSTYGTAKFPAVNRRQEVNTKIIVHGETMFKVSLKELNNKKKNETIHLKNEDGIFLGNYFV